MLKLIFRSAVALLSFSTGMVSTMLVTNPDRSFKAVQHVPKHEQVTNLSERTSHRSDKLEEARAASVAVIVKSLREIETDQFDNNIPRRAKLLLTSLKHQLRDLITETIIWESRPQERPLALRANILAQLKDAGVTVRKWEDVVYSEGYFQKKYSYGDIFGISIEQVPGHPELLVATTTLGLCCGEDTSLYLYRNDHGHWKLILAQESNDYDQVSGAQGRFQHAISPTDQNGDFFVVTANVNPWCTSNWQSIRYRALRPGSEPYQPRTILSEEDTIYLGDDPPFRLRVRQNGFTLDFAGESNPDEVTRRHVVSYHINGDQVTKAVR